MVRVLRGIMGEPSAWLSTGTLGGGAIEYARASGSGGEKLRQRRLVVAYNVRLSATRSNFVRRAAHEAGVPQTSSIRADDHSTIGGVLFAVLTPALFWKRANALNCAYPFSMLWSYTEPSLPLLVILGGAGIGSAVGLLAHYGRSLSGDRPPVVEVPKPENPAGPTPPVIPPAL